MFSFSSFAITLALSESCLIYEKFFARKTPLPSTLQEQKPFQLVLGFFIFNTLLFLMTILGLLKVVTVFGCWLSEVF